MNIDGLADVVVGFSEMAVELGDLVDAVAANPVIASPDGVVAVDALIVARAGRTRMGPRASWGLGNAKSQ